MTRQLPTPSNRPVKLKTSGQALRASVVGIFGGVVNMMKSNVPGSVRREVFRRDLFTCQECRVVGSEIKSKSRAGSRSFSYPTNLSGIFLSIDHIIPRYMGGTNNKKNLRCLCTKCNIKKGVRLVPN